MHRVLLGLAVAVVLLAGFFLVYFSASDFRKPNQSYLTALSDFGFMVDSYRRQMTDSPLPLTEKSFASVMGRFRADTHWEVREWLLRTLQRWGQSAAPWLEREASSDADPYRLVGAAQGLVASGHPRAAPLIATLLGRYFDDPRRFRSDFIDALGDTGDPRALEALINIYRRHGETVGEVLEAVGKCGGTGFLLDELAGATTAEEIRKLIWPLAFTRSPEGARAIAGLMLHRQAKVRVRAYSALAQTMGSEAVEPMIDLFRETGDEYILSAALNQVLARSRNRSVPQLVPFLAGLVDHPTLGWEARYALARVGGAEAVATLQGLIGRERPEAVLEHLDYLGEAALPILGRYLAHESPWVRRQAMFKAQELINPAVRPLIEPLLQDNDRYNRRYARRLLFSLDPLNLLASFTLALPESTGRGIWQGFRGDMRWGFDRGYRSVLRVFSVVHWAGIVLSAVLGLLLVANRVRVFHPYRFNLFVGFLLAEGLVGNFFLLGSGRNHEGTFVFATGIHLLLLTGFLFQERERLPGELRSRFERLGGASLWLLAPLLILLGTPLIAEGLRLALRDFRSFLPYLGMAFLTIVLVLEQWALPWRLFARSARLERLMAGVLAAVLAALFAWPLLLTARQRLVDGNQDAAVLAGVLIAPLVWMLLFHLGHIGLLRPGFRIPLPDAPAGQRLQALADGDRISVSLRTALRPRALAQGLAVFASGGTAAFLAGHYGGGGPGMLLAFLAGLTGAALAGLIFEALEARLLFQMRAGLVRCAVTRFGAALRGGEWRRRLILAPGVSRRLAAARRQRDENGSSPLTEAERGWLRSLQSLSRTSDSRPSPSRIGSAS